MIEVSSPLTLQIATAFGVYMLVAGSTGIFARDRWVAIIDGFEDAPALTYFTGVFVFILGVVIILVHNIWTDFLSGFISFVGWAAAIEGLVLIVLPEPLIKFSQSIMRPSIITGFAIFTIVLGGVLLFAGLTGTTG